MAGPMATPHHWSRVQLVQGQSQAGMWDLAEGVPPTQLIVGAGQHAGWHVAAGGVAAEHFALYWDGVALFAHPVTADVDLDGERLLGWRQLVGRCRLEFGEAAMTIESSHLVPVAAPPPVPPPGYIPTRSASYAPRAAAGPAYDDDDAPTDLHDHDAIEEVDPSGLEVLEPSGLVAHDHADPTGPFVPHGHGAQHRAALGAPEIYAGAHGMSGHDPGPLAPDASGWGADPGAFAAGGPVGHDPRVSGDPGAFGGGPQMPRHGRDAFGEFAELGAHAQEGQGGHPHAHGEGELAPQSTMLVDPHQVPGSGGPAPAPSFGSGAAAPVFGSGTVDESEVPASPTMVLDPNDPAALGGLSHPSGPPPGAAPLGPASPGVGALSMPPSTGLASPGAVGGTPVGTSGGATGRFAAPPEPDFLPKDLTLKEQLAAQPKRVWVLLAITIVAIGVSIGLSQYKEMQREEARHRAEEVRRERLREASREEAAELRERRARARAALEQTEREASERVSERVRTVEAQIDEEVRAGAGRRTPDVEIVAEVARRVRLELEREAVETLVRNEWALALKYYELLAHRYPEQGYYGPMVPVIRSELRAQLAELGERRRTGTELTMSAAPAPHEQEESP